MSAGGDRTRREVPECGYVGFEETARCRHCGYDSHVPPPAAASAPVSQSEPQPPLSGVADEAPRRMVGRRHHRPPIASASWISGARGRDRSRPSTPPRSTPSGTVRRSGAAPGTAAAGGAARPPTVRAAVRPAGRSGDQRRACSTCRVAADAAPGRTTPCRDRAGVAAGARLPPACSSIGLARAASRCVVVYLTVRLSGLTMARGRDRPDRAAGGVPARAVLSPTWSRSPLRWSDARQDGVRTTGGGRRRRGAAGDGGLRALVAVAGRHGRTRLLPALFDGASDGRARPARRDPRGAGVGRVPS